MMILLAIGFAALMSGATYAAVVNNWFPSVTGTVYGAAQHDAAIAEAYSAGERVGVSTGFQRGHAEGLEAGIAEGETAGFAQGEQAGYAQGHTAGVQEGYSAGSSDGYQDGYVAGENAGWTSGYDVGYGDAYAAGWADGCNALFNGLGTDRIGDWWDYYYGSSYGSYYARSTCNY